MDTGANVLHQPRREPELTLRKEVATLFRVDEKTIWRWTTPFIKGKPNPLYRPEFPKPVGPKGSKVLFNRVEIYAYLNRNSNRKHG